MSGAGGEGERAGYGPEGRAAWSAVRAQLAARGFHPSRRLGQNFLLDENTVRSIARDARVGAGDRVLEIGTGCGFLTWHLAAAGARVVSVEVDRRLFELSREALADQPSIELLRADALAGKHRLAPELEARLDEEGDAPWHLVANLPYSISSPLLCLLAEREDPPRTLTVLVQLEVAERIVARPGAASWGPLGLRLALAYEGAILRRVPASSFWPRPKVDSAVVRLERRAPLPLAARRRALGALGAALMGRRRQSLSRLLGERLGARGAALEVCAALAIDPRRRGETLTLEELERLHDALAERSGGAARDRPGGAG